MPRASIEIAVNEVFELFEKHDNADYIGEAISQLEHACQAACKTIIRIRLWNETAKEIDVPVPDMKRYRKMAVEHLLAAN